MHSAQHPSPWSGKFSSNTHCTVGIIGESPVSTGPCVKFLFRCLHCCTNVSKSSSLFYETGPEGAQGGEGAF